MKSHFFRFGKVAAALGVSAALLVGCGGSTVTSDDVETETTVAPLERSATDTTDATEPAETTSETTETTGGQRPGQGGGAGVAAPPPEDQGAREISEIPDTAAPRSGEDDEFLTSLEEADVDVAGVEESLLGTATTVCASDGDMNVTANAVAGQLVEQGRTELAHDEVADLIVEQARTAYCP